MTTLCLPIMVGILFKKQDSYMTLKMNILGLSLKLITEPESLACKGFIYSKTFQLIFHITELFFSLHRIVSQDTNMLTLNSESSAYGSFMRK